ncbi:MAG: hypothetical protein IKD70_00450, partial [Eggerthellaceae bacterium]|nr:hypothetical protein [Eggerthellaceae bacterium]
TVYGSSAWNTPDLTAVLSRYPQVVDFSGHSHYPIENPRSIWQGSFTALGTGSLTYFEMGLTGVSDSSIFPVGNTGAYSMSKTGARDADECYIVEVDKYGAVRITGYELTTGTVICRYYLRTPALKSSFTYTDGRADTAPVPSWASGAELAVEIPEYDGVTPVTTATVMVPSATCADGVVESYRAEVFVEKELVRTVRILGGYFLRPVPETMQIALTGLEPGVEYEVHVYAANAWGKDSGEYLSTSFTMPLPPDPVEPGGGDDPDEPGDGGGPDDPGNGGEPGEGGDPDDPGTGEGGDPGTGEGGDGTGNGEGTGGDPANGDNPGSGDGTGTGNGEGNGNGDGSGEGGDPGNGDNPGTGDNPGNGDVVGSDGGDDSGNGEGTGNGAGPGTGEGSGTGDGDDAGGAPPASDGTGGGDAGQPPASHGDSDDGVGADGSDGSDSLIP